MNRPGPNGQTLRNIPSNMFQNQQNSARGAPLGANRLQNGKIGSGSQWVFSGPMGGAPGLSNAQSRANGGGLSSFAQTIGGSQSHTPLNLEEFPSLSGTPHAQQNTTAQQMWSNPSLRTAQHSTIQRPQGQGAQQGQGGQSGNQQIQGQGHDDGGASTPSQFTTGGDDYRFGGQAGVGQLSGGAQPQTGNIDEFPPLGGGGADVGPDRRTGMIQNAAAYGANANATAFPGLGQTRNGLSSPTEGQQNSGLGGRGLYPGSTSRTPFENMRGTPSGLQDGNRSGQPLGNLSNMGFVGSTPSNMPPVGQRPQQDQFEPNFGADTIGSPNTQQIGQQPKKLSEMTETERYGLPGLLSMIPLESPDYSSLAVGQDLTVLGLDLSRPDNSPLHPTFGSPFVDTNSKPVIPPDFKLPAAYTVTNVPPLHSKVSSFSAETLLAIFYQFPRDIMQEIAASELYNRDWRWHIKLQQWMMKDPDLPAPVRISAKVERGWYLFFDVMNWRRERFLIGKEEVTEEVACYLIFLLSLSLSFSVLSNSTPDRRALMALSEAVREMTPLGAKQIPAAPSRFNMLARTYNNACRICNLPGHQSANVKNAAACRDAVLSLFRFWEDQAQNIEFLYTTSHRFHDAVNKVNATYDMRLDNHTQVAGSMEEVVVDRMTKNYLKFQTWFSRVQAKMLVILDMEGQDGRLYGEFSALLNNLLLKGESCKLYAALEFNTRNS
ncbi:hypothetical protein DM02DRAFT_595203 [Periconia macrospinosa]|uniref:NOT2/NOT3/NOT5 C-terminal domain-containing protein n=1 Tax=Periconia macrospinosa TaxID=97972 RepID=A0A2V1DLG3_9PLEO|nr:hypothetical protein DM02DRAFT_595203 [Periconia macrospinosa]